MSIDSRVFFFLELKGSQMESTCPCGSNLFKAQSFLHQCEFENEKKTFEDI